MILHNLKINAVLCIHTASLYKKEIFKDTNAYFNVFAFKKKFRLQQACSYNRSLILA